MPSRRRRTRTLLFALVVVALATPSSAAWAASHKVRRGDTLGAIGERYGCSVDELRRANDIRGDIIRIGQTLEIPNSCKRVLPDASASDDDGKKAKRKKRLVHEVIGDETLEEIALRYGMPLDELQKKNARLLKRGLKPGLKLRIETTQDERAQRKIAYTIASGDTLSGIAKRFGISLKDLRRMNPGKDPDRLRIGDRLLIYQEGRPGRSQAVGRPQHGRLVDGEQLEDVRGAFVLRPIHAWGTNETIRALKAAIAEVRNKHKGLHDIVVGDISRKEGGFLRPHRSHQSGLDVDLGFYFEKQPKSGPRTFLDGTRATLDLDATWDLILALAGTSESSSNVEYMFIGYPVQKKLYEHAKEKGVSDAKLAWIFQYPRGSRAMRGLVRHEPGHTNHVHIRFKCPNGDSACL